MIGWLVNHWLDDLVGWLNGWFGWMIGWLVNHWLDDWLVGESLVGW